MKTIIIGFDAFEPRLFEQLHSEGKTPNLSKFIQNDGYRRFAVANPPQSEVSWTSIATGQNPGVHGMFDFVHRNPKTYELQVSLLPTKSSPLGTQFIPPHQTKTIFDIAVEDGYPASSLWWPATFPARLGSPVRTVPGLGTPDVFGRLGVGFYFSLEKEQRREIIKTHVGVLVNNGDTSFSGRILGPTQKTLTGSKTTAIDFQLKNTHADKACLQIGDQEIVLIKGEWSRIFEIPFKVGMGISIISITRVILISGLPSPIIYLLPLQIHPLHPLWPYGTPKGFIHDLWKINPFLTLGWPQDTTSLDEGIINREQFLELCNLIFEERRNIFLSLIESFEEGVLACVFDSLDRIQHMCWRDHRQKVVDWYIKLDQLVGQIQQLLSLKKNGKDIRLVIVSDHGFGNFDYRVHLNRWLINRGYLVVKETTNHGDLKSINWSKSQAYALGLNSLYINLFGREGQGVVTPEQKSEVMRALSNELSEWKGPDGNPVIHRVLTQEEAFTGSLAEFGPDLVVGYREKYRASAETGLGQWEKDEIEQNLDEWGADHCFDAELVPGVLFSNHSLLEFPNPSYKDIPAITIGKQLRSSTSGKPPVYSDEDKETVEARLKDLGYL